MNVLNRKLMMVQAQQTQLTATSILLTNIRMNALLTNDEAEAGVSSQSEDLGK